MLTVLLSGLPLSAKELLSKGLSKAFGEGTIDFKELTKDNLRQRVRLSKKDVSTVLVVLDGVSCDICKDIEDGLYSSDKFYEYKSDVELVDFLNNKYSLSLEMPVEESIEEKTEEEVQQEVSEPSVPNELIEEYEGKIRFLEMVNKNLKNRLSEQQNERDNGIGLQLNGVKEENIQLKNKILSNDSVIQEKEKRIKQLETSLEESRKSYEFLQSQLNSLRGEYDSVLSELSNLRVTFSQQTGVLREKESRLQKLEGTPSELEAIKRSCSNLRREKSDLEKSIKILTSDNFSLKEDLKIKESECIRYLREVDDLRRKSSVSEELKSTVDSLRKEISESAVENKDLKQQLEDSLTSLTGKNNELEEKEKELTELKNKVTELEERVSKDDEDLSQLNKERMELQSKVEVLESSVKDKGSEEMSDILKELSTTRTKLNELSNSVFCKIASLAMPNVPLKVKLVKKGNYKNIRFVFSGNTESRKGTYKALLREFQEADMSDRYLIVDLVSETSVDYVFQIARTVPGIDWFRKGGSVQPYLSKTVIKNVDVLSCGLGYINDSYFLCINWEKRLQELENSGYNVVLYCGDISNAIGRVLHESFADLGSSVIYIHGNVVGSRALITNLRGLSNSKSSIIAFFEYNSSTCDRFYKIVAKNHECRVLSTSRF